MHRFPGIAREVFQEHGFPSTDSQTFKPHITLFKLSKMKTKQQRKGFKL